MSLDDLLEKINTLAFEEVFHQPYDTSSTFQQEALDFIRKYFDIYLSSNAEVKSIYEEYLVKSIQVVLIFKILDGDFNKLMEVLLFLNELNYRDNAAFENVFKKVLESDALRKRINEFTEYYKSVNLYPVMRNYSIYDYFNISKNILFAPNRLSFSNSSSITTDSKYLYIILTGINGGMLKVGTGNSDTIRGKVYLFEKIPSMEEASYQWVYARNKLYLKVLSNANRELGHLTIINPETLKIEGRTKLLLPESVKHPILKKKNENFVLLSDSNNLYVILLEPVMKDTIQVKKADNEDELEILKAMKDYKKTDIKEAQYPSDIFTYLNLVCLTFPLDDNIDDLDDNKDHVLLINEVYDSFNHLFSKQECKKALILNKWDIEKTAMYLVDNEKDIKQPLLISTDSTILFQTKIEQTIYKSSKTDFKIVNNIFDVTFYDLLKWSIAGDYILAYKIKEGACVLFSKDKKDTKDFSYKYILGKKDVAGVSQFGGFASQVPNDIDELYRYTDYNNEAAKMTFEIKDNKLTDSSAFYRPPFMVRGNPFSSESFSSSGFQPKDDKNTKSPYYINPTIRNTAPKEVKCVKRKKEREDDQNEIVDLIENEKKKKLVKKENIKNKKDEKKISKQTAEVKPDNTQKVEVEEKVIEDNLKGTFIKVINCLQISKHDISFCYDPLTKQYYILINGSLISLSILVSYTFENSNKKIEEFLGLDANSVMSALANPNTSYSDFKENLLNLVLLFHTKKPELYWKYDNWNFYFNSLIEHISINRDFGFESYSNEYPYPLLPGCSVSMNPQNRKSLNHKIEKTCDLNEKALKAQLNKELQDNFKILSISNSSKTQSKFFTTSYSKNDVQIWSNWDTQTFKFERMKEEVSSRILENNNLYLITRRAFFMCIDGEEHSLENLLKMLEDNLTVKNIWFLYFWCESVNTATLLKGNNFELIRKLRNFINILYDDITYRDMAIRIILTGWEYICADLKTEIFWFKKLFSTFERLRISRLSSNHELNILNIDKINPFQVLLQKFSWSNSLYLKHNFNRVNVIKMFMIQEDGAKQYLAKSNIYTLNPKNVCFPLHWLLVGKMLRGENIAIATNSEDMNKSVMPKLSESNFEDFIDNNDFKSHFRLYMEKNNISMDKLNSMTSFLEEGGATSMTAKIIDKLLFKKFLYQYKTDLNEDEIKDDYLTEESNEFWDFLAKESLLQVFLDCFLLCLGDINELHNENILLEFLNKSLDFVEKYLTQGEISIALAVTVLNAIYSRVHNNCSRDRSEVLRQRIESLNKKICDYFKATTKPFNLLENVMSLSSGGYQLEKEKSFEFIMNPIDLTFINETVKFPGTETIVVDIELKLAKDKPVNYDLIIISDEHNYQNLRYNTNNNYNSFGTCFLMKTNTNFTKRLFLSGNEIKIISPSELELNKGSYKAKLYPKKDTSNLPNKNSKSFLKIKCYPYQPMLFAYPKDVEHPAHKFTSNEMNSWLNVLKDNNYHNSYINKNLLKSLEITANEDILNETVLRLGLYNYNDSNVINITSESILFNKLNYNPVIQNEVEILYNALSDLIKPEINESNQSELLSSEMLLNLKAKIREFVAEPMPYRNLKLYPSFNNRMKALWNIVEQMFILCLTYHLNINSNVTVNGDYLQLLGKKMNVLLSWMASRAQLLKSTFDSMRNYLEMIVTANNTFVSNLKAQVLQKIAEQNSKIDNAGKDEISKVDKTKKDKKIKTEGIKNIPKPINFKKKTNVKRLYQELPKKKKTDNKTKTQIKEEKEEGKEETELIDLASQDIEYFFKNYQVLMINLISGNDNIEKIKNDIRNKIETDIKDTYFANPENLKNILETNNLNFNENNLMESLKTYTNFILKTLSAYYNFDDLVVKELDSEMLLNKLYTNSPYSNIAVFVFKKLLFLLELNNTDSFTEIDGLIKQKSDEDIILSNSQQIIVKSIFNFLYKNVSIEKVKHYMFKQYQRLLTRHKGIEGLVKVSGNNKSVDQIFLHHLGSICFSTRSNLLNGIETVSNKLITTYIQKSDINLILNNTITSYNQLLQPLNLKELKCVGDNNLSVENYQAYIFKNLILALSDINILLSQSNVNISLELLNVFIRGSNDLIFNSHMEETYKSKLQKFRNEYIECYKLVLSKLVNLKEVNNTVVICLLDTLDQLMLYQDNGQLINILTMIHDISTHLIEMLPESLNHAIAKLFELIINSDIYEVINLSCKICKSIFKNNRLITINETILNSIYEKIGKLYTFKEISLKNTSIINVNKKYVVMVQMNSPEIDYQFLINALYYWEEKYPTKLSIYKFKEFTEYINNPDKEKEILEALHLNRSQIGVINYTEQKVKLFNYFNPLKSKVTKMSLLEKIAEERINNLHKAIEEGTKFVNSKSSGEKPTEGNINIELIKERIMRLRQQEAYQVRIQSHIKTAELIGETACTRGFVCLEPSLNKKMAEELAEIIHKSYNRILPHFKANIDESICLFNDELVYPKMPDKEQLLPGCTNTLKETTVSFMNVTLLEESINEKFTKNIKSFNEQAKKTGKTTLDDKAKYVYSSYISAGVNVGTQPGVSASAPNDFNSNKIIENSCISGTSITMIIEEIIDLVYNNFEENKNNDLVNLIQNEIQKINKTEWDKVGKTEKLKLLGLLVICSGFYQNLNNNSKATFNKDNFCKILSGGHKTGKLSSHVIFLKEKHIKLEKVNTKDLDKVRNNSRIINNLSIGDLIEALINSFEIFIDNKDNLVNKMLLHLLLKILNEKSVYEEEILKILENEQTVRINRFTEILKLISNETLWLEKENKYWEVEFIEAFERIYNRIDQNADFIYTPVFHFIGENTNLIPLDPSKTDTNDLITKYQLPPSNYVRYLPKITDLSKCQTALKNIQNFDRYVVGEIFNYCKSQYRDDEYLNSLYQIRYHLSNNDITSAWTDINIIFDNNKVPPHMPLPKEYYDMKEIAKEECYPGNYYLAKLSSRFIRESGIKSLIKQGSVGINEFPVLLLAHDNTFGLALVLYTDIEYGMVYTFWLPIDNLMFLEQQIKIPANSFSVEWLLNEFFYLEKRLRILYSKNILTNFSYILTKNKKVSKFEELMYFIDLTNWQNYKLNPATGVFHDFTNYISIKNYDFIQNSSNNDQLKNNIQDLLTACSKISNGSVATSAYSNKKFEIEKIINGLNFDNRNVNELVTKWCMDSWDNIDKSFKKIRANLYNEYNVNYNESLRSKRIFNIGNFSRKMLALHELLDVDISNYASIILSFEKDAFLGPHSKISFYSDPYGENLIHEIQAIKTTKNNLESIVFNYPKIWMHYTPATRAFYIFEWFVTSRDSNLSCSLIYLPHNWSTLISLTDYTTSTLFTDINRQSLDSFEKVIKKLLNHCISLSLPAELHRRVFNITNRIILKASKYLSLLGQQKKIKFNELSISQKFNLIGIDEYTLIQLITNINQFNNSADKSFSSAYVVEGVEILLSILGIIKESYNSLDQYLKDTFDYNLPIWIEAIIKLGQFLSFFQGTSNLEGILMKEVYDQLSISNQMDNLLVIRNIPAQINNETILNEITQIISNVKARIVDKVKDIQILDEKEHKTVCLLIDSFIIENVKEEEQELPEPEDPMWTCFYCGMDNDKDNIQCIFCDKNKKVKPKENPKKKSSLIKTLSINEKMKEFKDKIKSAKNICDYNYTEQVEGSEDKIIKKSNSLEILQGDDLRNKLKDDNDKKILNEFLYKRLISYITTDKDYIVEKIEDLEKSSVNKYIVNEITLLRNVVGGTNTEANIDMIKLYEVLQNNGIDFWLENVVLDPFSRNMEINIHMMEKIRELVDLKICEEKMSSLIYPAVNIRFVPNNFNSINHSTLNIIENCFRELREVPLEVIRYYWVLIKYFNNCLSAALPFIKPPDAYSGLPHSTSEGYINIPFPKTISAFLSSARGIAFSIIKQNLIREITSSTEFNEEEVQIPTFKFERLSILNNLDKDSRKKPTDVSQSNIMGDNNLNAVVDDDNKEELKIEESLFLQACEQAKEVDLAFFRSKKLPADPHVAFKVDFKGELVQGIGGPYRQFFSDISAELQNKNFKNTKTLKLLFPTSNNQASRGEFKDKYTVTPSYNTNTALNQYEFLGTLMGVCIRTGVHLTLDLCSLIWKKIVNYNFNP
jgi:hypothetical protein